MKQIFYFDYNKFQNKAMYSEDQFQFCKSICKTSNYQLNSNIQNNKIQLHLKSTPGYKEYRRYTLCLRFQQLELSLRQKFENLKNFQSFLSDSNNLNVNLQTGTIELVMSISLFNGKSITSKLGEIKLKESIFDCKKSLKHIQELTDSKNFWSQKFFKNITRQLTTIMNIMNNKIQKLQAKNIEILQNHKELASSQNNFLNPKMAASFENTIKSQKHTSRRKYYSFDQQGQFQSTQKYHRPLKNNNIQNEQLENWKKQTNKKITKLTQQSLKNVVQFNVKLQQLKNQLLYEINQNMRSQTKQNKQTQALIFNSNAIRNRSPSKSKLIYRKNILNKQKQELDSPMSLSPNKSIKNLKTSNNLQNMLNINSKKDEKNTINLQQKIKKIQLQLHEFSDAVMKKILKLGSINQLFEDKLKKVVEELDIRIQQRILQEGIKEVKDKIIDTATPFFKHFQLKGTQIQYNGEDSENTMLIGKVKLSQKNTYSIKIVKTLVSNIQIGIVDSKYRSHRDCLNLPNFLLYVGWSSTIYQGPNDMKYKQGEAIKQGDVITVIANTETGQMQWIVKGQVRAKYTYQKLKDKSISWVPMIRFYDRGDVISWITDKMLQRI